MRRLRIRHLTRYRYDTPAELYTHKLLLRPREGHDVRVESSRLAIQPAHTVTWHRDVNNNSVAVVEFQEWATLLEFDSEVVIEHYGHPPLVFSLEPRAANFPFHYEGSERPELASYQHPLFAKNTVPLANWIRAHWIPTNLTSTTDLLDRLNSAIPAQFAYTRREDAGVQRPDETLAAGSGSCRDLATLFIEACRQLGFAARFVSGYLFAPGLAAADGATHAWAEVYLPGAGWRGYDSTTGQHVGEDHIAVAVARHPESIPPVAGSFAGPVPGMEVEVQVTQIDTV